MDTKFSVALHILIYISETDKVVSSELLAKSVNTNSSYLDYNIIKHYYAINFNIFT